VVTAEFTLFFLLEQPAECGSMLLARARRNPADRGDLTGRAAVSDP